MNILIRNDEWDIFSSEKWREFLSKKVKLKSEKIYIKKFLLQQLMLQGIRTITFSHTRIEFQQNFASFILDPEQVIKSCSKKFYSGLSKKGFQPVEILTARFDDLLRIYKLNAVKFHCNSIRKYEKVAVHILMKYCNNNFQIHLFSDFDFINQEQSFRHFSEL